MRASQAQIHAMIFRGQALLRSGAGVENVLRVRPDARILYSDVGITRRLHRMLFANQDGIMVYPYDIEGGMGSFTTFALLFQRFEV